MGVVYLGIYQGNKKPDGLLQSLGAEVHPFAAAYFDHALRDLRDHTAPDRGWRHGNPPTATHPHHCA